MSADEKKAIVRRIHDELNQGNLRIVEELYAPDYVSHVGNQIGGLREYKEYLVSHRKAFPDWQTTIEEILAVEDLVVTRISERGTHLGEWNHRHVGKVAATDRAVSASRIIIRRIANGRVAESWISADHLGLLTQVVGAIQTASGAAP